MVLPSQLAATSLEKSGIVQRSPVPPGCRNTWSAHERGVDRADRKPGAVFFGAKHATMLAANAVVTREAVSKPAGGAVLNEAAEDIRVNDSPTIKLPQNERQQWVESGCGAVAVGRACLLPPLSSGGALVARP